MSADETAFNRKLVDSKQRWAKEGRLLVGIKGDPSQRLPPGQREVKNWPVLDLGVQPEIPLDKWRLFVNGLVDNPQSLTWDEFMALPQSDDVSDIHCVTAWSRFENHWRGVTARDLLAAVRPQPEATHVIFHAYDTYTTNLPLPAFDDDDVLLAHSWEGKPITKEHGGPVRVIVPKLYFWKSAKWVKRIEFVNGDRPGFWEERGYHNEGDPWSEQRYA